MDFVGELRQKIKISDVVGEFVSLKKRGANFVGLCPFHAERTPSFSVSDSKGIYYCFGCQKGGDLIQFTMEMQGVGFSEAVATLAYKVGLKVPEQFSKGRFSQSQPEPELEVYFKLNRFVAQYFHEQLNVGKYPMAIEYLTSRGVNAESIKNFYLGYATDAWQGLANFLLEKKAPTEKAEHLGLIKKKTSEHSTQYGDHYDVFRHRVMFPVLDRRGRVIAFGGRDLGKSEGPKYLNSSESLLFNKSKTLYGLFQAQKYIRDKDVCVVVEGYLDCVMLAQEGIPYVVATLGTALTTFHAKILGRLASKIVLLYDGDQAGRAAQEKALSVFLAEGIQAHGVSLPNGMDPDEYVRQYGAKQLEESIGRAPYLLDMFIANKKMTSGHQPSDRDEALKQCLQMLASVPDMGSVILRLQELAEHFGVDVSLLDSRLKEMYRRNQKPASGGPVARRAAEHMPRPSLPQSAPMALDHVFLGFMVRHGRVLQEKGLLSHDLEQKCLDLLQVPSVRTLIQEIFNLLNVGGHLGANILDLIQQFGFNDLMPIVLKSVHESPGVNDVVEWEFQDLVKRLKLRALEKTKAELKKRISEASAKGEDTKVAEYLAEFNLIQKNLDVEFKGGQKAI